MVSEYKATANQINKPTWKAHSNNQEVTVSPPQEFGGQPNTASPEHLYALSLLNCYLATVKVIAKKSNFDLPPTDADITVELDADKEIPLSKATITLYPEQNTKKLQHILQKAQEHCYIHQSIKTKITILCE